MLGTLARLRVGLQAETQGAQEPGDHVLIRPVALCPQPVGQVTKAL